MGNGYHADGLTKCKKGDPCKKNNGGCSSQRTCTNNNGVASCGPCPNGYHADGLTKCKKDDPCKKNNGGCVQRTCTNNNFVASCGPCPAGYHINGPKTCAKDTTTTTPQKNCVFCHRQPPIAFMIDRSGSMGNRKAGSSQTRFHKVTFEVIRMLQSMPDGTLFSLQAFTDAIYKYKNSNFVSNSAAERNALQGWFNSHGPWRGTYMYTGLSALLSKKSIAKTLYFLADGEMSRPQYRNNMYSLASNSGVKIHVVGVDLNPGSGGYNTLTEIARRSGGSKKWI